MPDKCNTLSNPNLISVIYMNVADFDLADTAWPVADMICMSVRNGCSQTRVEIYGFMHEPSAPGHLYKCYDRHFVS